LAGPGRHLASLRHCVGLSWLAECLTGTFWLTDRDKALKTGTVPAETGRMACPSNKSNRVFSKHVLPSQKVMAQECSDKILFLVN